MTSSLREEKDTAILSKLDNLFSLLDTGSNTSIRKAAADQIGEIQKYHPSKLHNLLPRVKKYLHSQTWDTRIAASQALHAIIVNVPYSDLFDNTVGANSSNLSFLSFETFDISQILNHGLPLLSSAGNEYSYDSANIDTSNIESGNTEWNKMQLQKRLGLVASGKVFSTGLESLFDAEDFTIHEDLPNDKPVPNEPTPAPPPPAEPEPMLQEPPPTSSLSAREKAQFKRKSRLLARQHNKQPPAESLTQDSDSYCLGKLKSEITESVAKRVKVEPPVSEGVEKDAPTSPPLPQAETKSTKESPSIQFCEGLFFDLFNPQWETRHGSAMGLREIIKVRGSETSSTSKSNSTGVSTCNSQWLEDAAIHFICVLTLDRFADYVSDEVVAPVRETCAQALGLLSLNLSAEQLSLIVSILIQLISQDKWEVQHGGLLGLKYILATRPQLSQLLLSNSLSYVLSHLLTDSADDVRAAAAATLLLGLDYILTLDGEYLTPVLRALNHCLEELDDLSISTTNVLDILSVLFLKRQDCVQLLETTVHMDIWELIRKVMQFTPHTLHSVRRCSVLTLNSLIQISLSNAYTLDTELLTRLLNLCFEHALLDPMEAFHQLFADLFKECLRMLDSAFADQLYQKLYMNWVQLLVIPAQNSINPEYLSSEFSLTSDSFSSLRGDQIYLGGASLIELSSQQEERAMRARELGCDCLCFLFTRLSPEFKQKLFQTLIQMCSSSVAQEILCGDLIYSLLPNSEVKESCSALCDELLQTLTSKLEGESLFSEMYSTLEKLIQQQKICFTHLSSNDILKSSELFVDNFNIDSAFKILNHFDSSKQELAQGVRDKLTPHFLELEELSNTFKQEYEILQTRVCSQIASVLIRSSDLPIRLNPFIRPLMDCVKREPLTFFQRKAASSLALLLHKCSSRTPSPNSKIVKNLTTWVTIPCKEKPFIVPTFPDSSVEWSWADSIFLIHQLFQEEKEVKRGRGHPKTVNLLALSQMEEKSPHFIQQRGAEFALKEIVTQHGLDLPSIVPELWNFVYSAPIDFKLLTYATEQQAREHEKELQLIVNSLITLTIIAENLHTDLINRLDFVAIVQCLQSNITTLRHVTSQALVAVINTSLHAYISKVCEHIIPLLADMTSLSSRQGASEFLASLIISQRLKLLPYISILFLPILGLVIDHNEEIRRISSHSLSHIIEYIPLQPTNDQLKQVPEEMAQTCQQYKEFTDQLLDPSKIAHITLDNCINAELRPYQQEGVNWLAFLNQYKLNGILCDDMGLGKTVQTLSILSYVNQERKNKNSHLLPSLVICPPTIAGHWEMEVKKFCADSLLTSLLYLGMPLARTRMRNELTQFRGLVISSYDIVRNDIDFLKNIVWDYIVLDEGHIIKNTKTKISKAVKELVAHHKLILSGTPLQNSVLELWSLFDFLMPSYLGSERNFNEHFSKPISNSRESKSSSKEQEAGMLALESLHRKVLPFILRRTKDDVLKDLPPKIIQDIYCKLSPLQEIVYEEFSRTEGNNQILSLIKDKEPKKENPEKQFDQSKKSHIFQALQYLRKICNHPSLVIGNYPTKFDVGKWLKDQNTSLEDVSHSCKLVALKQLLIDCCNSIHSHNNETLIPSLSQHRVLIFCQLKHMLDLIQDMIGRDLPQLSYLRLDGSVPVHSRMNIVNTFNSDPSIDILLLTTHVGGLGLTLTGADVVIFIDHDWNPMKDLQAMDRAHRIGQKKVVNVYRLIAQGTLEESIMGLQRFKMKIANTVITEENLNLNRMSNQNMLSLFNNEKDSSKHPLDAGKGAKSMLENLQELWDESEYQDEYSISNFISSIPAKPASND